MISNTTTDNGKNGKKIDLKNIGKVIKKNEAKDKGKMRIYHFI